MNEFIRSLFAWYSLVYTIPLVLVIVYGLLRGFGDLVAVSSEPDIGDVAIGQDDDRRLAQTTSLRLAQWFFRLDELPLTFVIASLVLSWGVFGNVFNYLFLQEDIPWYGLIASGLTTATLSILITKLFVEIVSQVLPTAEHPAMVIADLVGATAVVLSAQVDDHHGRARVMDQEGNPITIFCRSSFAAKPRKGDRVVLVEYDVGKRVFEVAKVETTDVI